MPLADLQAAVRDFVVAGGQGSGMLAELLAGGAEPLRRLAIHRRNYHTSLVNAILGKFPATAWLIGGPELAAAASAFIVQCPPSAPCIAEYGAGFPAFLRRRIGHRLPYLGPFAELEWRVGHVAVAVDAPAVDPGALAAAGADLGACRCKLQPGVRFLRSAWPVDRLFEFFLTDSAPPTFAIAPEDVALQVRGARGAFGMQRITPGRIAFREALAGGETVDFAVATAVAADRSADPVTEVASLLSEGLLVALHRAGSPGA